MKTVSLVVALCSVLVLPCGLSAQKGVGPTEDQVFDANRQAPLALLQKLYKEKRVIAFGEPGHEHETTRQWMLALLDKVGWDPQLKYVVLEWPLSPTQTAALERLSVDSVAEADLPKVLGETASFVCMQPSIAHMFATLVPKVRAINARRPAGKKLLLVPVDGMEGTPSRADREMRTTGYFQEAIWSRLGPSDKALVFYHQWHLIKRFPFSLSTEGASWMQRFLTSHPEAEAQMAIIAVDYRKPTWDPGGSIFAAEHRLAQRQSTRYPGQSWGVRLTPFRRVTSITAERGAEMFVPKTSSRQWVESSNAVDVSLPEVEDAIIWEANPVEVKKSSNYLSACKSIP